MAYLTVDEYLRRFGEREATLLTNTDQPQGGVPATYDPIKVEDAISDATEEVEGYIARRYATPLDSPPAIVKSWVAAIARLKLSEATGRVSQAVLDAASRVDGQLAALVARKLDLPIDDGETVIPAAASGTPMSSGDRAGPVFTGSALDTYTAPFTGFGGYNPCWRRGE